MAGHQPERKLKQAAGQQRDPDQQSYLGVAQPQITPDQRKRGTLSAVG